MSSLFLADKIPSKILEIETWDAITESVMFRVSFNTSSKDVLEVFISSAITSKVLPKSIVPPATLPPETVACIGFCLKAAAID